jgi:hypothetical protein
MPVFPILALGTTPRLCKVGPDDAADSAVALGCAVAFAVASGTTVVDTAVGSGAAVDTAGGSLAAVAFAGEAATVLGCSPRNFPTPALPDFVEGGWVGEAFRSGDAAAAAAGEVFAWAEGRSEFCAEAVPVAPLVVELLVADGCDGFEELSSAHAIPHVVRIAAPTPRATASPPTRPMHIEALIVHISRRERCRKRSRCPEPLCP